LPQLPGNLEFCYTKKVKTDLTTYGSMLQSQNRATSGAKVSAGTKSDAKLVDPQLLTKPTFSPDYKVDISKPQVSSVALPTPTLPSVPTPDLPKPELNKPASENPEIKKPDIMSEEVKEAEVKEGTLKKPAIIFIKGLDIFSSPSTSEGGYAGVGKMAESIEGSRMYGWDQQDEIIKEIKKRRNDQPIVLVGHSLGGDTAHEVAEALDSLEHQFRKVDLLVTIDAFGADHSIISQNVKNHLNVFGESNFFLNDGPHVARRHEMTKVKNILSPHDHTELDDDREIQYEVVNLINETLSKKAVT
jgi:hypothetical protein